MSVEVKKEIELEIAHVLFIDTVGYSKLLIDDQRTLIDTLNQIVRGTAEFQSAEAARKLIKIATGDGMALVFYTRPEAPVECALQISRGLKEHPELRLRMGVHSGPVSGVIDVNERANVAGAGINMARRVMECGDAGHILLSQRIADDLDHYGRWRSRLHDLGECEAKHGARIHVFNFYTDELGNPELPKKFTESTKRPVTLRWALIGAAALIIALLALAFLIFQPKQRSTTSGSTSNSAASVAAVPEKSIAVMPFENRSEDKANAYFADGIQDEILTRLSKIADLKVISRTSTQHYKSAPENLPEIAKELGVAHILEGSVQKSGDAVRVNVQLIKAANDSHLWADTFDRKLTDIFSVESEVAKAIADQLRAKLTGQEERAIADKPTQNPAAYDAYLCGRSIERNQFGFDAAKAAGAAYAEAVRIDPSFAMAWASLAIIRGRLYLYGVDATTNTAAATREAADKAMSLQPESAEAWMAQAAYRYRVSRDFRGAVQAYEEASKRLPNGSQILVEFAVVETRLGSWESAEAHWRKAMDLDPRNSGLLSTVAIEFLSRVRRFAEAH